MWLVAAFVGLLLLANVFSAALNSGETLDYSAFKALVAQGRVVDGRDRHRADSRHVSGPSNGAKSFVTVRVDDPKLVEQLAGAERPLRGRAAGQMVDGAAGLGPSDPADHRALDVLLPPDGRRRGRHHVVRPQPRQDLRRRRRQGQLRGRRRRRRSRRRAARDRRVPEDPEEVHDARRPHSEGRAARRPARHRQDAARPRRRRRSEGPLLQPERIGVRRDVRRRRRGARARSVPPGRSQGAVHRLHRRARRARQGPHAVADGRPRGARADAEPAARGDGRLRLEEGRHHHGRRRTGPRCSTPRCSAPAGSTGRCSSTNRTSRAARRSSSIHVRP